MTNTYRKQSFFTNKNKGKFIIKNLKTFFKHKIIILIIFSTIISIGIVIAIWFSLIYGLDQEPSEFTPIILGWFTVVPTAIIGIVSIIMNKKATNISDRMLKLEENKEKAFITFLDGNVEIHKKSKLIELEEIEAFDKRIQEADETIVKLILKFREQTPTPSKSLIVISYQITIDKKTILNNFGTEEKLKFIFNKKEITNEIELYIGNKGDKIKNLEIGNNFSVNLKIKVKSIYNRENIQSFNFEYYKKSEDEYLINFKEN